MTLPMENLPALDPTPLPHDRPQPDFDKFLDQASAGMPIDESGAPASDPPADPADNFVSWEEEAPLTGWGKFMGKDDPSIEGLDRPLVMARKLLDNWENWGMQNDVSFGNPPNDLPEDAKEVLKFFVGSPTAGNALDNGFDSDKKANGTITKREVDEFIKRAEGDLEAAGKAYEDFLLKYSGEDDAAKALAQSAAILMANQSLLASAGDRMKPGAEGQRQNNGGIQPSNLAGAAEDSFLGEALRDAVATWKSSGMLGILDIAGSNPTTVDRDRVIGRDNIASWLKDNAPSNGKDAMHFIQQAGLNGLADVAGSLSAADKKQFFENLDDRSTRDKAGVLAELTQAASRLAAGKDAGLWGKVSGNPIDDDFDVVERDLKEKIELLAKDPEVRAYITNAQAEGLSDVVSQSPVLKEKLQQYFDAEYKNTEKMKYLDFSDMSPAAMGSQLASIARDAALFDTALGGDGSPDLTDSLKKSGKYEELEALYDDIKSGKALAEQMAAGVPMEDAMRDLAVAASGFSAFFGNGAQNDSTGGLMAGMGNAFVNQAKASDLDVFRGPDGEIDEKKLSTFIEDAMKQDPKLFADSEGQPISPQDIVGMVKNVATAMGTGLSGREAMAKLGWTAGDTAPESPKLMGALSGVSAVVSAGVLLTRVLTGDKESATGKSLLAANAITLFGAAGGLGAKVLTGSAQDAIGSLLKAGSPLVSAAGSVMGGALGIVGGIDQLNKGNTALGAAALTDGIVGSGLALLEGAAAISGAFGLWGAGTLSAISSALGPAGWAIGISLAGAQLLIKSAMQQQRIADYVNKVGDTLNPYGIGKELDWESRARQPRDPSTWSKY